LIPERDILNEQLLTYGLEWVKKRYNLSSDSIRLIEYGNYFFPIDYDVFIIKRKYDVDSRYRVDRFDYY